jgi:hypothetical protein
MKFWRKIVSPVTAKPPGFITHFWYGPPLYSYSRFEAWIPCANLSVTFSPALGVSVYLDRRVAMLSLGVGLSITLTVTFPPAMKREVLFKRTRL